MKCKTCDGLGFTKCEKCSGEGVDYGISKCSTCAGEGELTCSKCEGKGKLGFFAWLKA